MKNLLILISLLTLTACGFHPVYGVNKYTSQGVEEKLEQINIASIPDREGQYLRNALIDRFYRNGRPDNPRYILVVDNLTTSSTELDITKTADATRGQLKTSAQMILTDSATGKKLLERNLQSIASYNILSSEFTNRVSVQNASENTINDIARQIELNIALYFKKNQ